MTEPNDVQTKRQIAARVLAPYRRPSPEASGVAWADVAIAWTLAVETAGDDPAVAEAGLDLARRRAERFEKFDQVGRHDEVPGTWRTFDEFIANSVHDARGMRTNRTAVLACLGWRSDTTSSAEINQAYADAMAFTAKVVHSVLGYTTSALAAEVLHQAIANVLLSFASRVDSVDIVNPKAYASQIVRTTTLAILRGRNKIASGDDLVNVVEMYPGPDLAGIAEPCLPLVRFGVTCRLFAGLIAPLAASLLLGLVSAEAEGCRLERWSWRDTEQPRPSGQPRFSAKYWVLRKSDPLAFTPTGGRLSTWQRQTALEMMKVVRATMREVWPREQG